MGAQNTAARPMISDSVPRPRIVEMAAARSRPGMASPRSVKRINTEPAEASAVGRQQAHEQSRHRGKLTETSEVSSVSRPAKSSRASTSRPFWSVPNG